MNQQSTALSSGTSTNGTVEQRCRKIIGEFGRGQAGFNADSVVLDKPVIEQGGIDSLDSVEIIMAAEDEFNIQITDEEGEKLKTPADLIALVKQKRPELA